VILCRVLRDRGEKRQIVHDKEMLLKGGISDQTTGSERRRKMKKSHQCLKYISIYAAAYIEKRGQSLSSGCTVKGKRRSRKVFEVRTIGE